MSWWDSFVSGVASDATGGASPTADIGGWLSSIGGAIGSGIEGAFVALLSDLWDVIIGPLEIGLGMLLLVFILVFAFKNEIMSVAPIIAMMA